MPPPVRRRDRRLYKQDAQYLTRLRTALVLDREAPQALVDEAKRAVDAALVAIAELAKALPEEVEERKLGS